MRILLVGPVPPGLGSGNQGGVAQVLWTQAQALRQRGHAVQVLALGQYYQGTKRVEGILVHGISFKARALVLAALRWTKHMPRLDGAWKLRDRLYLFYTLYRLSLVEDLRTFDIIHIHGPYNTASIAGRLLGVTGSLLVTIHSYHDIIFRKEPARSRRVQYYTSLLRDVDGIIHVSHTDREKGWEAGVRWTAPDGVVHNAVTETRTPPAIGQERQGVCFVGSLIERKGIRQLLTVWEEGAVLEELRVVGAGPLAAEVEAMAVSKAPVRWLGYQPEQTVRQIMRSSLALVVPSLSESFGLVYLEALLEGTPVVGYHKVIEEFREVLACSEAERRFLVPVDAGSATTGELAEAIAAAVEARRRDGAGLVAQGLADKIARHFSFENAIASTEMLYTRMVRRGTSR